MRHAIFFLILLFPLLSFAQLAQRSVFGNAFSDSVSKQATTYKNDRLQLDIAGDTLFLTCFRSGKQFYRQPYFIVCGKRYGADQAFQCELYHSTCEVFIYGSKPDSVKRVFPGFSEVYAGNLSVGRRGNTYVQFDSLDRNVTLGYVGRRAERRLLSDPQAGYQPKPTDLRIAFFVWVDAGGKVSEIRFNRYASTTMREEHFRQAEAYFKQLRFASAETLAPDYIGTRVFYCGED